MSRNHGSTPIWIPLTILIVLGLIGILVYLSQRFPANEPIVYEDDRQHFLYGSIAADLDNGLPLRIMEVLPELFPEHLPEGAPRDWTAFGFIMEPGHSMPIGFSTRVDRVPLVGFNCATCHTGEYRADVESDPTVVLGMGSTTLDLAGFFQFLFAVVDDARYTPEYVLAGMDEREPLDALDRLVYTQVIHRFEEGLNERRALLGELFVPARPPFGPGRVDTFNPYKLVQLANEYPDGLSDEEAIGTARYASIWNQAPKRDIPLNWDGNAPRIHDRNMGAALGAGATPRLIDLEAVDRIQSWLETLPPPDWPFEAPDPAQVEEGAGIYASYCADCHDPGGSQYAQVVPVEDIGTSPDRVNSYTDKLNTLFLEMGRGEPWELTQMRKTNGYLNRSLDGLWARAPYLHNGSVPTLMDLLAPEAQRNGGEPEFWVGHGVYDPENVGLRTDVQDVDGQPAHVFDVRLRGNSNQGHSGPEYGTELTPDQKRALLAYLTTL
ncbi:MAG: cytochrome c [Gemmatimonadota bacterium]